MSDKYEIDSLTDYELIDLIVKTNDSQMFGLLYDRYANLVYNRCLVFFKSKVEAQDVTHDIFVTVFLKLRTFEKNSRFNTWLYTIVYNACINHINKKNKNTEEYYSDNFDVVDNQTLQQFNINELKSDILKKAMNMIHPKDKMILLLKYQDDVTNIELQNILGIGESGVKMRLKRAKYEVKTMYDKLIRKNLG